MCLAMDFYIEVFIQSKQKNKTKKQQQKTPKVKESIWPCHHVRQVGLHQGIAKK